MAAPMVAEMTDHVLREIGNDIKTDEYEVTCRRFGTISGSLTGETGVLCRAFTVMTAAYWFR